MELASPEAVVPTFVADRVEVEALARMIAFWVASSGTIRCSIRE
jgi:hypothetical protein